MCGIFGRWALTGRALHLPDVVEATTCLRHRGPDDEGYLLVSRSAGTHREACGAETAAGLSHPHVLACTEEPVELALAHRRLAILDLSAAGHQPMPSSDRACWIVFNGEVYNYRELRRELEEHGHHFITGTDTEVVLAAYREWGTDAFPRFNGMWALAIWDAQRQELLLSRDRFGVKPLHYVLHQGTFSFASEIKALVGPHGVRFEPDDATVYAYLLAGRLPSPRRGDTFFRGVRALPPGCLLRITPQGVGEPQRWYRLPDSSDFDTGTPESQVRAYAALLYDAVQLRLRADVPVGSCLSGGLDSSAIVCLVQQQLRAAGPGTPRQRTFSAVYGSGVEGDERPHIDTVIAATGADAYFTTPTAEQLQRELPALVYHQDEPFLSTSIFAQWCVMRLVRESGVTVLLDGQGADEALAGYRPYDVHASDLLRRGDMRAAVHEVRAASRIASQSVTRVVGRALAWQLPAWVLRAAARGQYNWHEAGLHPDFAATQRAAHDRDVPLAGTAQEHGLQAHLRELVEESSLPHLLRYEDRNSMAFHIEARVPFVDVRLMEFAFGAGRNLRIRDGWTKWILRQSMQNQIPQSIVWRRDKIGFATPQLAWVTALLTTRPEQFADGALSSRYLDLSVVRAAILRLLRGGGDPAQVWRWVNLDHWLAVWTATSPVSATRP
jgi:asparagine synthase (glutamine-hydrolysing)